MHTHKHMLSVQHIIFGIRSSTTDAAAVRCRRRRPNGQAAAAINGPDLLRHIAYTIHNTRRRVLRRQSLKRLGTGTGHEKVPSVVFYAERSFFFSALSLSLLASEA